MSDMANFITAAAQKVFEEKCVHIFCEFHLWNNFLNTINRNPPDDLKTSLINVYHGALPIQDFLATLEFHFGADSAEFNYFNKYSDYIQANEASGVFI